jgi:hypothetical protein
MHRVILSGAALLVPAEQRSEWLDEWLAELAWVLHDSPRRSTEFCLGAFRDAFWIRRHAPPAESKSVLFGSPVRCLVVLTAMAALAIGIAWRLPGPRLIMTDTDRLVTLSLVRGRFNAAERRWLEHHLPPEFEPGLINDPGLVLARLKSGVVPPAPQWRISIAKHDGRSFSIEVTELRSMRVVLSMLWLVVFSMPFVLAGNSLSLGRYRGPRLWIFFASELTLLVIIVLFTVMDFGSMTGAELRPHGFMVGFVIAFRWALKDQRRRCPVCLHRLTNPIVFGQPAHAVLDWYGTELICAEGHGMMHVPELPTSSYPEPEWVSLEG